MSYILYESASGYALFQRISTDEIGSQGDAVQSSFEDYSTFSKVVRLIGFVPFLSAQHALENINNVSEGIIHEHLKNFLEQNLSKSKETAKKRSKIELGVAEEKLAVAIHDELGITCTRGSSVNEILRGIRWHFSKFIEKLSDTELAKAQLGLAHSYSRSKVKFNINRVDNMIIQSICLLDQLDKDVNTFAMRVREWYSWHFPELVKIVPDNHLYVQLVKFIGPKNDLKESHLEGLIKIIGDEEKAKQVLDAARSSMGTDLSEFDMSNISHFATKVESLIRYRSTLSSYLVKKMHDVAPNLSSLIGETVGARLISHAGSLINLAKYPASTVQILGAEKALFRALKTRGNTPKYGLLFNSSFIGRASTKNKGRISRYVANKCSIAARIDAFSDFGTTKFGEKLKEQVEERLSFYDSGETPRKNVDVMKEAFQEVLEEQKTSAQEVPKDKKKKRKAEENGDSKKAKKGKKEEPVEEENGDEEEEEQPKKKKKSKGKNKEEQKETPKKQEATDGEKKKKKKKKSKSDKMEVEEDSQQKKKKKKNK